MTTRPGQPMALFTPEEHRALVASQMTEATLQTRVEALARELGWLAYHPGDNRPVTAKSGRRYVQRVEPGFPDLVLVRREVLLMAELKTQTGRLRPEQRRWHEALTAAGVTVYVWRPLDLLDGSLARLLA
jgi:hypothetical protein